MILFFMYSLSIFLAILMSRWIQFRVFFVAVLFMMTTVFGTASVASTPLEFTESTKIYDRGGGLLYEYYGEVKRTPISLDEIPMVMQHAVLAVEDKDFYSHGAVSFSGMARAAYVNYRNRELSQGGSTISQQLVRTVLLTREKSFKRKFKEIVLSIKLEKQYTKPQILEMYLNDVPYGSNAYGVQAAAMTFFGKDARNLSLAESAYLAAFPKAPSYYSPYGTHRVALDIRQQMILRLMYEQGYSSESEMISAQHEQVKFIPVRNSIRAPHFVMEVLEQLRAQYGEAALTERGLRVRTTLDPKLQTDAEAAIAAHGPNNERRFRAENASLVAINPGTGEILAMVGSRNYFDEAHDGAVNVATSLRQPGSSFKPYVYATAFAHGMNPASVLMDVTTNFGTYGGRAYVPRNYDGTQRGPVSVRKALQGSLNIPAVKTLMLVGIDASIATATAMGISTLTDQKRFGPSIVLGGAEVTLLDHTSAYGVFATGGVRHAPIMILDVQDASGRMLHTNDSTEGTRALDPSIAYQITNILSDNESRQFIFRGLSRNLVLPDRPVAAKTGTTQKNHDAWTLGYTPDLVAGVWVGNNDNREMRSGADGSVVAAPIWHDFMVAATSHTPVTTFQRPPGIFELAVDVDSGKLPGTLTKKTKTEIFCDFNAPTHTDDLHVAMRNGDATHIVSVYHSEKPADPLWEGAVQRWLQVMGYYPYVRIVTSTPS